MTQPVQPAPDPSNTPIEDLIADVDFDTDDVITRLDTIGDTDDDPE